MAIKVLMLPGAQANTDTESLSLLDEKSGPRPYQAYCVTEASSRPPSPESFTLPPLHTPRAFAAERDDDLSSSPNTSLVLFSRETTEQESNPTILPNRENESSEQRATANQIPSSGHTKLTERNHIAQAVTPRGSHPLAGCQSLVYDRAQSHPQMVHTLPTYMAEPQALRRKSLPRRSDARIGHRPLPQPPVETLSDPDHIQSRDIQTLDCTDSPRVGEQDERAQPGDCFNTGSRQPLMNPRTPQTSPRTRHYGNNDTRPVREDITKQGASRLSSPGEYYQNSASRHHSNSSLQSTLWRHDTQLPSSEELYIPRGILEEEPDERRAHRRTQPKDAKFRYPFGCRPSLHPGGAPSTPPHKPLPALPDEPHQPEVAVSKPAPYFPVRPQAAHSQSTPQSGPRPPPWSDYDSLETQRRNRGDAREREDARQYRILADGGSSLHKSDTACSGTNSLRREVEEYREQVLQLYPDLEFDGTAGGGGRSSICCLVM